MKRQAREMAALADGIAALGGEVLVVEMVSDQAMVSLRIPGRSRFMDQEGSVLVDARGRVRGLSPQGEAILAALRAR